VPKLYSSRQVVTALEGNGFDFVSQRGSHVKYRKDGFADENGHRSRRAEANPTRDFPIDPSPVGPR